MEKKQLAEIKESIRELQSGHAALLKLYLETHPEDMRRSVLDKYASHKVTALSAELLHWVTDQPHQPRK